jgi:hypothetical protein
MAKKFKNSICNKCHWCSQCGGNEMFECTYFDRLEGSQDVEDRYLTSYIEKGRIEYRQEYQDYLDYIDNDRWGDGYDL